MSCLMLDLFSWSVAVCCCSVVQCVAMVAKETEIPCLFLGLFSWFIAVCCRSVLLQCVVAVWRSVMPWLQKRPRYHVSVLVSSLGLLQCVVAVCCCSVFHSVAVYCHGCTRDLDIMSLSWSLLHASSVLLLSQSLWTYFLKHKRESVLSLF